MIINNRYAPGMTVMPSDCIGVALPLSKGQEGVWFSDNLYDSGTAYTTSQCVELRGPLCCRTLHRSILRAVNECGPLHVRFLADDCRPLQQSIDPISEPVSFIDLRSDPAPDKTAWDYMRRMNQEINLASNDLYRIAVIIIGDGHALWSMSVHHIVFDAHCYGLFQSRVSQHYASLRNGTPLTASWFGTVVEMIEEEQRYTQSGEGETDRRFWKAYLGDSGSPTTLAGRWARGGAASRQAKLSLPPNLYRGLERIGRRTGSLVPEVLVAAIGCYLARMTDSETATLGFPMMGRPRGQAIRIPVTRVNVLPLHLAPGADASFMDWLQATSQGIRTIARHQRYRCEDLVRELKTMRDGRPLFGPLVNILPPFPSGLFPGCVATVHHLAQGPVDDLRLTIETGTGGDSCRLTLDTNPVLYTPAQTRAHADRLGAWLDTLIARPDEPVATLPLATAAECAVVNGWNATSHPVDPTDLATLFERQVALTPSRTAVIADGVQLDYRTLDARARRLAVLIGERMHGDEAVVAVALPRSVDLEVTLLAVHKASAAYMPIADEHPPARIERMLGLAGSRLVITQASDAHRFPEGVDLLFVDRLPEFAHPGETPRTFQPRSPNRAAYVIFTSGSTGEPKGVVVEHDAVVNRLLWMQDRYPLTAADRVLQKTPAHFDVSVWEFFWPVIVGATLVMARPEGHHDPDYLCDVIEREAITTMHFVPSMLAVFLDSVRTRPRREFGSIRRVFSSGEALSRQHHDLFFETLDAELHNLYGPTEAAIDVTAWRCRKGEGRAAVPIGRPIWNTAIHILNAHGQTAPIGTVGELFISGRGLARGYVGRADLTGERFPIMANDTRMYRTGDLASWSDDGVLHYHGRTDFQVKLRGLRIELDEIVETIRQCPGVQAAAAAVHDEHLIGYAVIQTEGHPSDDIVARIKARCREWLPSYMVPAQIVLLPGLPLTSTGKLDRKALPKPIATSSSDQGETRTLHEQWLCELFAEVLGVESVGPQDNFFDLGGHSLSAVRLARRVKDVIGWDTSIATVFAAPTPARLASTNGAQLVQDVLDPILILRGAAPGGNPAPPLFCVHPAGGIAWCYSGLSRFLKTRCAIIGLQARGLRPGAPPMSSMVDIARDYVEQIRRHQPKGPYCLLGWSVGGMIAHTMAALLEQAGESVQLLALLDAFPSDLWRDNAPPDETDPEQAALAALLYIAGLAPPYRDGIPSLTLPAGVSLERSCVIDQLRAEGNALGSLDDKTLDRLVDVVINSRRLVRTTEHHRFGGNMLFFTAARPRAESWLRIDSWKAHVGGTIRNVDVDSDHPSLVRPPAMRVIAQEIDFYLAEQGR